MSPRVKPENRKRLYKPLRIPKDESDIGYLAGLIDGEGNIQIIPDRVTIRISSTSIEIIDFLGEIYNNVYVHKTYPNRLPSWDWCITRTYDAYKFLIVLLPYLRDKQKQAELALISCEERLTKGYHSLQIFDAEGNYKYNEKMEDLPL